MNAFDTGLVLNTRWRLGHRVFEVILAAIINLLKLAAAELATADYAALSRSLDTLAILLASATSAMHFTADFDPAVYRDEIRPTMQPPRMPPGFSGTLNERHAEFLELFRSLELALRARFGSQLEDGPSGLRAAWKGVITARSRNLAAHGLVCEQFVPGGESLLKDYLRSKKEEK